jgi:hypothetical protein
MAVSLAYGAARFAGASVAVAVGAGGAMGVVWLLRAEKIPGRAGELN